MTDYVLNGLAKRRAEPTGEMEAIHLRLRTLPVQLESLDATIRQFDPSHRVEAIHPKAFRPPSDWANRSEMSRVVLSIVRHAAEPPTTHDIALKLLVTRVLDASDQRLLELITKRVSVALQNQRTGGVVRSTQGPGTMLWKVARPKSPPSIRTVRQECGEKCAAPGVAIRLSQDESRYGVSIRDPRPQAVARPLICPCEFGNRRACLENHLYRVRLHPAGTDHPSRFD